MIASLKQAALLGHLAESYQSSPSLIRLASKHGSSLAQQEASGVGAGATYWGTWSRPSSFPFWMDGSGVEGCRRQLVFVATLSGEGLIPCLGGWLLS